MSFSRRSLLKGGGAAATVLATGGRGFSQEKVVQIGFPFELSGRFVSFGSAGKRGAEMALEAFNYKLGNMRVEPLFRDVQSDNQVAVSVMTELVLTRRVNFIVGPLASPVVAASIPVIRQTGPLWFPGATAMTLENEVGSESFFFHTVPYAYDYHASESAALRMALGGGKKVAVIYSDDSYGQTHLPFVEQYYAEAGFEIVAKEVIRTNSGDLNPVLTRINRAKPDILIGLVQTTDAITLAKQIETRRLDVPVLVGTAYPQSEEWQNAVGDAQEGWIGVTTYLPGLDRPASEEFPEIFPTLKEWSLRFSERYSAEADFLDVTYYTTTALLLIAIQRAGTDDKDQVAAELRKLDIQTIHGRGKFAPSKSGLTKQQAFTDMIVFQRQNGANVLLYPAELSTGNLIPIER